MIARAEVSADREINRGYLDHIRRWSIGKSASSATGGLRHILGNMLRLAALPFLLLMASALIVVLRLSILFRRRSQSVLHDEALPCVDSFVEQYPLHLYPIVAKAIELSYLRRRLASLVNVDTEVVEVAIGEGTLSARVFDNGQKLTGLDLNPYSLVKAVKLPHVRRAVICDGLNPPVLPGAFDLLLSNNFLHHVTEKEQTIRNWSNAAPVLLFNENTPYWASGWTIPFLLKKLGLRKESVQAADKIERHSLQHLEGIDGLEQHIRPSCDIEERCSFMSEQTFFYCSLFSFFMKCYGPPTPAFLKGLFLGALRPIALPLTRQCARLLIRYDALEKRSTDTFVVFLCKSRSAVRSTADQNGLVCPLCRTLLQDVNRCITCGRSYPTRDGMLFLLPPELSHVLDDYASERGANIPDEHL